MVFEMVAGGWRTLCAGDLWHIRLRRHFPRPEDTTFVC